MEQAMTLHWQERRLGRTLLRTYRDTVDIYDVFPNEKQPRMGPKEDPELQRQIEANEGIFEPLLLEPHPEDRNKFRIIDGDRRWTNSKILVEVQKKEQYKRLPAETVGETPEDALFLQFSGGTTGAQKCVLVTAAMLEPQLRLLAKALEFGVHDSIVNWLPMYHDMGLIACLWLPLWFGAPSLHFSKASRCSMFIMKSTRCSETKPSLINKNSTSISAT